MRLILFFSFLIISGCATNQQFDKKNALGSKAFIESNNKAAESIHHQLNQQKIPKNYPIIITSIVNMNQLNQTSTFGRLVSEQLSSKFAQLNYQILEPKLRSNLLIREDGEFLITRELKEIAKTVSAQAVIVGTYVDNGQDIYVNVKVVQPFTNTILAAHSYAYPKAKDITVLLQN